jgi:hypothetical protein
VWAVAGWAAGREAAIMAEKSGRVLQAREIGTVLHLRSTSAQRS